MLLEYVHGGIWSTEEGQDCSISSISDIDRSILGRLGRFQRFCSFEGVDVVLEDSHDIVLVEEWHPVK
jgi:hypothetical protein